LDRNPVASEGYAAKEIPKLDTAELVAGNHQIPNKSQITIPNDQNIYRSCIASFNNLVYVFIIIDTFYGSLFVHRGDR